MRPLILPRERLKQVHYHHWQIERFQVRAEQEIRNHFLCAECLWQAPDKVN